MQEPGFDALLREAQGGSAAALGALYRQLFPAVLAYLRARDPNDAEDLTSEVFLNVAEGLQRFTGDESSFRGWVFTIARRRAVDAARRRSRRSTDPVPIESLTQMPDKVDTAAEATARFETDAAAAVVRRLPERQADVVMLRVIAGLSVAETAAALRTRPGTVRVLQHRALRRLAELLDEDSAGGSTTIGPGSV
jgi:RNA polymerase sigma-70 factor (ECF subfamily)